MNNLARNGLTVIHWENQKKVEYICIVYKYPDVGKIKIKKKIFEEFWPGMLENIKYISSLSRKKGERK